MELKKQLIIVSPLTTPLNQINQEYSSKAFNENLEINIIEDQKELIQFISFTTPGQSLIIFGNPKKCATFLQENKLLIGKTQPKIVLISPLNIPTSSMEKFNKAGLTESIQETTPQKNINLKINFLLQNLSSDNQAKTHKNKQNIVVKSIIDLNHIVDEKQKIKKMTLTKESLGATVKSHDAELAPKIDKSADTKEDQNITSITHEKQNNNFFKIKKIKKITLDVEVQSKNRGYTSFPIAKKPQKNQNQNQKIIEQSRPQLREEKETLISKKNVHDLIGAPPSVAINYKGMNQINKTIKKELFRDESIVLATHDQEDILNIDEPQLSQDALKQSPSHPIQQQKNQAHPIKPVQEKPMASEDALIIDYQKLKKEFLNKNNGNPIDGNNFNNQHNLKLVQQVSFCEGPVIEVNATGLCFAIKMLILLEKKNVGHRDVFRFIAEELKVKYEAYCVFYNFNKIEGKYNEVFNSFLREEIPLLNTEIRSWFSSTIDNQEEMQRFFSKSSPHWFCRDLIASTTDGHGYWIAPELPNWSQIELSNKKVELYYPYYDGVDRIGCVMLFFPNGVSQSHQHSIHLTIDIAQSIFLDLIKKDLIEQTISNEIFISEEKEKSKHFFGFISRLFSKSKAS